MTGIPGTRENLDAETDTHTRKCCRNVILGFGATHLQAKGHQRVLANTRSSESGI